MRWIVGVVALALVACGGKVVVDQDGAGGQGASGTGASASVGPSVSSGPGPTATVGTGPSGCTQHGDCPGGVCIFSTGTCAPTCESDFCASCTPGTVCNGCATSSCPECADCLAACLPTTEGGCDDNDPCPPGQVCLFGGNVCAASCETDADCNSGFRFCETCATGSCCGCDNCVSACLGGE